MSEQPEITSDDKLLAALGYPIAPLAVVVLLMEEKKNRPFIKFHAVQALVFNIALWAALVVVGTFTFGLGFGLTPLFWLVTLWPAFDSFNGNYTRVPIITDFIKRQGWV